MSGIGSTMTKTGITDLIQRWMTPLAGRVVDVIAGLLFMLLCMLLPLVGPAGSAMPFRPANYTTFSVVLILVVIVSGLGVRINWINRNAHDRGWLVFPVLLTGIGILTMLAFAAGLLKI